MCFSIWYGTFHISNLCPREGNQVFLWNSESEYQNMICSLCCTDGLFREPFTEVTSVVGATSFGFEEAVTHWCYDSSKKCLWEGTPNIDHSKDYSTISQPHSYLWSYPPPVTPWKLQWEPQPRERDKSVSWCVSACCERESQTVCLREEKVITWCE